MGGKLYTEEEIRYLEENWQEKSIIEMAKYLGREQKALGRKLSYLGFTKDIAKNIITEYEDYAEIRVLTDTIDITSKIDIDDIQLVLGHTWNLTNSGYLASRINMKNVILHRHLFGLSDPNIIMDHINQDKLDNRRANLRFCTKAENNQNKFDPNKSSTGKRGVILNKSGVMTAQIKVNGVQIFLKNGLDLEELSSIAEYARAYIHPFSREYLTIPQEDIPQWIKDKIDARLEKVGEKCN